jgi:hypothetical protein
MILRRVIEHVRRQEWTAIWIDLAIVVVGVFIGIQVANWNQARADERLGRAYEARLAADLEQDLASRQALVAYYGAVLESVERTDALLANPLAEPKDLLMAAYRASELNYVPPSRATWDEIVSSGDTGLLPRNVARGVAEYFAYDTSNNSFEVLTGSAYRHRVRMIIPLAVQKALRAGCSDVRNELQQITGFMPDCKLDLPPAMIAATAAALRADPAVQESLRYQYSEVFSAHTNIQGDVAAIEVALAALKDSSMPAQPHAGR